MIMNQATDYAFRAVNFLAKRPGEVIEAQTIAEVQVIPMRFLLKIMPSLIRAGIVNSFRGFGGGYTLAKENKDITFLAVIEAIEGPLAINRCLRDPSECNRQAALFCKIHPALAQIQSKFREELKNHNFAEL